jgi:hypothetical protein
MSGNYNDFSQPTEQIIGTAVLEALSPEAIDAALEGEIWQAVERRNSTWVDNDFDGHMAIYHSAFRRWSVRGDNLFTKSSFAEFWQRLKRAEDSITIKVVQHTLQWLVPGQAAVAHYRIDESFRIEGELKQGALRFSDIYLLEDGEWRYAGGHRDGMTYE